MEESGLEEELGAAYTGIKDMLSGNSWIRALWGFRMVASVLLVDFLQSIDNFIKDLCENLKQARSHLTGCLWAECLLKLTFIAHQSVHAESEGDWVLQ